MSLPTIITRLSDTTIFGFDSAWTDNNPGAICVLSFDDCGRITFNRPGPVNFTEALSQIKDDKVSAGRAVVAIDQPTIVPNEMGMRPAERVAASLLGCTGGGVQPANRGNAAMFGDEAPIWQFKMKLGAEDNPECARKAELGWFLIEA